MGRGVTVGCVMNNQVTGWVVKFTTVGRGVTVGCVMNNQVTGWVVKFTTVGRGVTVGCVMNNQVTGWVVTVSCAKNKSPAAQVSSQSWSVLISGLILMPTAA